MKKKYLVVYDTGTSVGSVDAEFNVIDMHSIRNAEKDICEKFDHKQCVITNLILLDK